MKNFRKTPVLVLIFRKLYHSCSENLVNALTLVILFRHSYGFFALQSYSSSLTVRQDSYIFLTFHQYASILVGFQEYSTIPVPLWVPFPSHDSFGSSLFLKYQRNPVIFQHAQGILVGSLLLEHFSHKAQYPENSHILQKFTEQQLECLKLCDFEFFFNIPAMMNIFEKTTSLLETFLWFYGFFKV